MEPRTFRRLFSRELTDTEIMCLMIYLYYLVVEDLSTKNDDQTSKLLESLGSCTDLEDQILSIFIDYVLVSAEVEIKREFHIYLADQIDDKSLQTLRQKTISIFEQSELMKESIEND